MLLHYYDKSIFVKLTCRSKAIYDFWYVGSSAFFYCSRLNSHNLAVFDEVLYQRQFTRCLTATSDFLQLAFHWFMTYTCQISFSSNIFLYYVSLNWLKINANPTSESWWPSNLTFKHRHLCVGSSNFHKEQC